MGGDYWASGDSPFQGEAIGLLLGGAYYDGTDEQIKKTDDTAGYSIADQVTKLTNPANKWVVGKENVAIDFGILREVAKIMQRVTSPDADGGMGNQKLNSGPWRYGEMKSKEAYDWLRSNWIGWRGISVGHPTGLTMQSVTGMTATQIAAVQSPLKTSDSGISGSVGELIDGLVDKLVNNTEVWGTGDVDTVDHMMGQVGSVSSGHYKTIYDVVAASLSLPAVTAPTIAFTSFLWSAPTVTISAPTEVSVADIVDDAVEAATALNDARVAEEEANLRAALLSANALAPSGFFVALELLGARSTAAMLDYDKSLRAEQVRTVTEAKLRHQQDLLDRDKAQADANLALVNAQNQWNDTNVRAGLGKGEVELSAKQAALEGDLAQLRVRADVVKLVYDTVISWMQAKGMIISNAGPLASVINSAAELGVKSATADREAWAQWIDRRSGMVERIASGYEGVAQLKWKALLQNIMALKEGVSAFQGIGGVEHMPSGFEKTMQPISAGLGVAATIGNLVNIFR